MPLYGIPILSDAAFSLRKQQILSPANAGRTDKSAKNQGENGSGFFVRPADAVGSLIGYALETRLLN